MNPFFTTKKGTDGKGLGLSITHNIIKTHGGELDVQTTFNKGSVFTIRLNSDFSQTEILKVKKQF